MSLADDELAKAERKVAAFMALAALCAGSPRLIQEVAEADGYRVKEILMECQKEIEGCAKVHALSFDGELWNSETYRLQNGHVIKGPIINPDELERVSENLSKNKLSLRRIRNMAANQIMG
ncbi:MAG TPA: hypothetical protein ENO31_03920 [Thermoprotei archaeon]|nr:hypothetical protein [TACK group archaeon]HEV51659.1 hypothetical protein [Thermoprotei archaeon]